MTRTFHVLIVVVCALVLAACENGPSFAPSPIGSGSEFIRLIDGAGKPGPVTFRWTRLTTQGTIAVSFVARVCYGVGEPEAVTPIPNPSNNSHLAEVRISLVTSADGVQVEDGTNFARHEGENKPFVVRNGECVNIRRIPASEGGTPGIQFLGLQPRSTHVLLQAQYGPYGLGYRPVKLGTSSEDACPPFESFIEPPSHMRSSYPTCILRWFTPLP